MRKQRPVISPGGRVCIWVAKQELKKHVKRCLFRYNFLRVNIRFVT